MRILMISEHASPLSALGGVDSGGQNLYVAQLAKHLAHSGCTVDIATRRDSPSQPDVVECLDRVRVIHVPAGPPHKIRKEDLLPLMEEFSEYCTKLCIAEYYDVVHANFWMSGLAAMEIKQTLGIPFIVTFHALGRVRRMHQGDADGFPDSRFAIEDSLVRQADAIVAECPQDMVDLVELYDADPTKLRIVPCGFDSEELWPVAKDRAREELGIPIDEFVALQLGRMVPRKGIDNAIRSFARFRAQHAPRPARLLIVGGESNKPDPNLNPEIARLMDIARQEGVADRVHFLGSRPRSELRWYFSAADAFITLPWYEPFGITPVEAMACGTPVIGSRVGGIKWTVLDGETGFLVSPKDIDTVASKLVQLASEPTIGSSMGEKAVERVHRLFTWEAVSNSILDMYEQVSSARSPMLYAAMQRNRVRARLRAQHNRTLYFPDLSAVARAGGES